MSEYIFMASIPVAVLSPLTIDIFDIYFFSKNLDNLLKPQTKKTAIIIDTSIANGDHPSNISKKPPILTINKDIFVTPPEKETISIAIKDKIRRRPPLIKRREFKKLRNIKNNITKTTIMMINN